MLSFPSLLSVWPIHLHRLILMSTDIADIQAPLYSSSFDISLASVSLIFVVAMFFEKRSIFFSSVRVILHISATCTGTGTGTGTATPLLLDTYSSVLVLNFVDFHNCLNVTNAPHAKDSLLLMPCCGMSMYR